MPEEINRVVTDRLSDLLFTPSTDADQNLKAEGIPEERIHFVGNVMIDSLVYALPQARELGTVARLGLCERHYVIVTLHRPSNVDHPSTLSQLLDALGVMSRDRPVIFPVHPRTRERIERFGYSRRKAEDLRLLEPLTYLEMLNLVSCAELVITDSGGLQEETSYLGIPCITVRPNTERPITCTQGTNQIVSPVADALLDAVQQAPLRRVPGGAKIEKWDGTAAERIVEVLLEQQ